MFTEHRKFAVRALTAGIFFMLVLALATGPAAAFGGRSFTIELTGAAEVPGPGDPDGSGTAEITLNPGHESVCWSLSVENILLPATGAHIHIGASTQAGPVVVPLSPPDASGQSSGCRTVDRELIISIITDPDSYYVNVHSSEYPAGAVRGQLER